MAFNVAIDGPAGAGKSTIAKKIAKKMGYIYVDTGAMYRAMALFMLRQGVEGRNEQTVTEACEAIDISIIYEKGEQQVLLNGENVTGFLRTEEVGMMASMISSYGAVRRKLTQLQQKMAAKQDVVMDGRDIGTAVLPNAQVKIYLTADAGVRAMRRYAELQERGEMCDMEAIRADILRRDRQDMEREIAPLKKAADAVEIDCSHMTIDEVAEAVINQILLRRG